MKKLKKVSLLLLIIAFSPIETWAQCTNTSAYGTVTAPTGGASVTISTVQYATEYATINSVAAEAFYTSTSSIATDFLTVRQGTYNGTVIASGVTPLTWKATVSGTYYVHCNTNSSCGTSATSRTTAIKHVVTVPKTGSNSVTTCSEHIYDNGGPNSSYAATSDGYTVIYPSTAGSFVQLTGSYYTESGYDYVYVYNGVGTSGAILLTGSTSSSTSIGAITSTDATGALTVRFVSDGSIQNSGFDFTIACITSCSGTPNPGNTIASSSSVCPGNTFSLSLQNALSPGTTYQWQSSADGVSYGNISGANASSYSATQTSATYYRCLVTCTNSSLSSYSTPTQVVINSFLNCYCSSSANYTADEEIYSVTINGITNSSTCGTVAPGAGSVAYKYSNFTTLGPLTTISIGSTISFSIAENECDGATYYPNGCAIWIDYNHNGSFLDAGEQVYVENSTTISPRTISGTFTVPTNAVSGTTMMRIIVVENLSGASLTPCLTYGYGETEDYLVNICGPISIPYSENFETAIIPAIPACTSIQNIGSGNSWITANNPGYGFTSQTLEYRWNASYAANAWFYTPGLILEGGTEYKVTFKYGNTGTTFPEKLKVAYGTSAAAASMTTVLMDFPNITQSSPQDASYVFTPTTNGIYFIGFNAYSDADMFYLFVDDIEVKLKSGLPISLAFFDGQCHGGKTMLSWSTFTETNNSFFTIEKSPDGINYLPITKIAGIGNSNRQLYYSYVDQEYSDSTHYYRLRQTDYDGQFKTFPPISVICDGGNGLIRVYPNPTSDILNIETDGMTIEREELSNLLGQTILKITGNQPTINISNLRPGIYNLSIKTADSLKTFKIIKE